MPAPNATALQQMTVIGLGLIGGSLCRAVRRFFPEVRIHGVDKQDIAAAAQQEGLIDQNFGNGELAQACAGSELIFLATPIAAAVALLDEVAAAAPEGAVVSDAGSLKQSICARAEQVFRASAGGFIGGHPMAGGEKSGFRHADPFLFQNAIYVLTPTASSTAVQLTFLSDFLRRIGAHVVLLDPGEHDEIVAVVSHLPQLLANTLMHFAAGKNADNPLLLKMAAGGFRDMTRIASSPFAMWKDICSGNRDNILTVIDEFIAALQQMRRQVAADDLEEFFSAAARYRLSIPKDTRGFLYQHFELSVEVEDRPGIVAEIAVALADQGINIKDIEVLKVRENEGGTFRLAFATRDECSRALTLLEHKGFRCREMF